MTRQEYLLVCLIEELSEVQKELSKCLRFGPEHRYNGVSNLERALSELEDVEAIRALLAKENLKLYPALGNKHVDKVNSTVELMELSRRLGIIC